MNEEIYQQFLMGTILKEDLMDLPSPLDESILLELSAQEIANNPSIKALYGKARREVMVIKMAEDISKKTSEKKGRFSSEARRARKQLKDKKKQHKDTIKKLRRMMIQLGKK